MTWVLVVLMGVIAWATLRRRSIAGMVLVFGYLAFGAAAALLFHPSPTDLAETNIGISSNPSLEYLSTFLVASFATWIGFMIVVLFSNRTIERTQQGFAPLAELTRINLPSRAILFAPIPLLLYIYGTGMSTILNASKYLQTTGPVAVSDIAHGLGPFGVLVCGYFSFDRTQTRAIRVTAITLAIGYELLYLGTATRSFATWPILMWAGGYLAGGQAPRRQRVVFFIAVIASILALQVPLGLRGLPEHGLLPSLNYLIHQPSLVFGGYDPFRNFLYGAPLTLYVAHYIGSLPVHDLVVSLNPLPSQFSSDWSQIGPTLKVNSYTPYSALGELLNYGWVTYISVMTAFGFAFAAIERLSLKGKGMLGGLARIAVLGFAALFLLQSTEYNLRTAARLMYYCFAVVLLLVVILPRLHWGGLRPSVKRGDDVPAPATHGGDPPRDERLSGVTSAVARRSPDIQGSRYLLPRENS